MTSIRNISRGLGAGVIGLGLIASLSVGGCGGPGDGNSNGFVDSGLGPNNPTNNATELTRIVYQFGPNGLNASPTAAFYDVSLLDASGAVVRGGLRGGGRGPLTERFTAGSQVQLIVPDDAVPLVASTRIDVIEPNGSISTSFTSPLTVVQSQTTVVSSATATTPTLTSIALATSNVQGQASLVESGRLQLSGGQQYPIIVIATYSVGNVRSSSNITSGVAFSVAPSTIGLFQDNILIPSTTVAAGTLGNITARFEGQTATLPVNATGIAAASPTPTPTPSPSPAGSVGPTPTPTATPTPTPGSSPPAVVITNATLILATNSIRNTASTTFGVNASLNGQTVNVSSFSGTLFNVTSSNSNVVQIDNTALRITGVGVGGTNLTGSITLATGMSAQTNTVNFTVTP